MLVREKKELMDTLLSYEAEQVKINDAQARLWRREERLVDKRTKTCNQLARGMQINKEAIGTPIVYKGKYFKMEEPSGWNGGDYKVYIRSVKKL